MQEVTSTPLGLQTVLAGLRSTDARERRLSARRFGALRLSDPFGAIRPLLDDSDSNIRLAAIDALEEVTDERAVPILLDMAATDGSQEVRDASLQELKKYRSDRILKFLLSESSRPQRSRRPLQLIAEQLGNYDTESSVNTLLKLTQDTDAYVQERAIESLFQLNRPRLLEFWNLIARDWEGTYWGDVARSAIDHLHSSKVVQRRSHEGTGNELARPRERVTHAAQRDSRPRSRARSRAHPHTNDFVNGTRRATDGRRAHDAETRLSETLRSMTDKFVLDTWPLLYMFALEKARDKLAQVASREPRTESKTMSLLSGLAK